MPPAPINPRHGQVWQVELDPGHGSKLQKTRPCVVILYDGIRRLPVRLVVPITAWQPGFINQPWKACLVPENTNGLTKESAADTLQTRCVDLERFADYVGELSNTDMLAVLKRCCIPPATIESRPGIPPEALPQLPTTGNLITDDQ